METGVRTGWGAGVRDADGSPACGGAALPSEKQKGGKFLWPPDGCMLPGEGLAVQKLRLAIEEHVPWRDLGAAASSGQPPLGSDPLQMSLSSSRGCRAPPRPSFPHLEALLGR